MKRRELLSLTAAAAALLATGGIAFADRDDRRRRWEHRGEDWRGRRDWEWRDDRGWHGDHDRYWREGYGRRAYIGHDRVFWQLRRHNYYRWEGEPYWYRGRYVVRTYNRWGRLVFVEIDPYSGDFIGEFTF